MTGVTQLKAGQTLAAGAETDDPLELEVVVEVELEVGVGVGVEVGTAVHVALVIVLPINVTALVCERARPFKVAPSPMVIAPSARIFPIN